MSLEPNAIDLYCIARSNVPSPACEAISQYTLENRLPNSHFLSGPLVGSLIGFLIGALGVRRVLEIGCYTGYSALAMAERLPNDGEVITLDINPETDAVARKFWAQSPHGKKIRSILK